MIISQRIYEKLQDQFPEEAIFSRVAAVALIDSVLKERNKILRAEENHGPGFNRDTVGFKVVDGTTERYKKNNPR